MALKLSSDFLVINHKRTRKTFFLLDFLPTIPSEERIVLNCQAVPCDFYFLLTMGYLRWRKILQLIEDNTTVETEISTNSS